MNIYNPNKSISVFDFNHYINQLANKFIIIGDYNAHSSLWESGNRSNVTGRSIEDILELGKVGILNDICTPTYIDHRTGTSSCLDLCIASIDLIGIGELHRGVDLGSDHFPIECFFCFNMIKNNMSTSRKWKTNKADWKKWNSLFEISRKKKFAEPKLTRSDLVQCLLHQYNYKHSK